MPKEQLLTKFHTHLINFLDELIQIFPKEVELITARVFLRNQIAPCDIMNICIKNILPYRDMIYTKNSCFFTDNHDLFSQMYPDKPSIMKRLWTSDEIDDDDKDCIFEWMKGIVMMAERYQSLS